MSKEEIKDDSSLMMAPLSKRGKAWNRANLEQTGRRGYEIKESGL